MKITSLPKGKRRFRGGALFLISVLMLGSAVLRIGVEAGPAISREAHKQEDRTSTANYSADAGLPSHNELQELLNALQERKRELDAREVEIADQMKAMSISKAALESKLAALIAAEEKLSSTLALANSASEDDLTRLTSVYEKMKPKEAATLFEEMAPEFAAGFLARMRSEVAAGILAKLSPTAAYSISVILAGRNANVPKS